jgi:hypothetical protein
MMVKKVDNIKDGNKAARRENMYGGGKMKNRYGMKHGGKMSKEMPKGKPC